MSHHSLVFRGSLNRVWRSYERSLKHHPIAVQATTSAVLWSVGDLLAQRVGESSGQLDRRRLALTAGFGAGFMGPVGHHWYALLDFTCRRLFQAGSPAFLLTKVLADTFVFGPIYVLAFYAYGCHVIDNTGWAGFKQQVQQDFVPTFLAELVIWPVFQTLNFIHVPLEHQLLAVNMVSLLDCTFLSWARSQEDWVGTLATTIAAYRIAAASKSGKTL